MNKLQQLYEYDKNFFNYSNMSKNFWRDLVNIAKKEFNISFDLENDYSKKTQRDIVVPQNEWEHTECKFRCELCAAGGDWEEPVYYFRCQIVKGYAFEVHTYRKSHFVYIPGKTEGNFQLWKGDKGWYAPNNDGYKDGIDPKPNEKKCWDSLKIYLKKLVDKEINKITTERELKERESNDTI